MSARVNHWTVAELGPSAGACVYRYKDYERTFTWDHALHANPHHTGRCYAGDLIRAYGQAVREWEIRFGRRWPDITIERLPSTTPRRGHFTGPFKVAMVDEGGYFEFEAGTELDIVLHERWPDGVYAHSC